MAQGAASIFGRYRYPRKRPEFKCGPHFLLMFPG